MNFCELCEKDVGVLLSCMSCQINCCRSEKCSYDFKKDKLKIFDDSFKAELFPDINVNYCNFCLLEELDKFEIYLKSVFPLQFVEHICSQVKISKEKMAELI